MKILIAGLGSIGRRHLANLGVVAPRSSPIVWRLTGQGGDTPSGVAEVRSLEAALAARPDAALVTCAASRHVEVGISLAAAGVHLFIEKPIANHSADVVRLINLCRDRSLVLMVGYNFRYYEPLRVLRRAVQLGRIGRLVSLRAEVGQYLPDWRPGVDYRHGTTAQRRLSGGVLLELSHEFDYARWIAGEIGQVCAHVGHLSDLEIDTEDVAEVIFRFSSGAIGSIHMDLLQRPSKRTCQLIGTDGTIYWDRATHEVRLQPLNGAATVLHPATDVALNDMYVAELQHFLSCVKTRTTPDITGEDGLRAVLIAEAAASAARTGHSQEVPWPVS